MSNQEKLAIDIFIKYSSTDINDFKVALSKARILMMRDIHLNENFNPKKYFRYYLTFKIIKLPERQPLPHFNIVQQRIERLHNAAISLEILEQKVNDFLDENEKLFFYFEVGGIYVTSEEETSNSQPWYDMK